MAGSPAYLAWLDTQQQGITRLQELGLEPVDQLWERLDHAWENLTSERTPRSWALDMVAVACYQLAAALSDQPAADIIANARALHIAKNAGYAGADNPDPWANFRMASAFGITPFDGVLVRMSDKYIRTQNLRRDPTNERVGEALVDTVLDLAAYAGIAKCIDAEAGFSPFAATNRTVG